MAVTLREYRDEDRPEVWNLHNRALHAAGAHAGNGPWDDDLHHVREVYLEPGGTFLVLHDRGRIVAMGALLNRGDGSAEMKRIRVAPEHQRQGHGKRIVLALEAFARARGFRKITLDTTSGQIAAQHLYEGLGYRKVGEDTYGEFRLFLYEKDIPPSPPA